MPAERVSMRRVREILRLKFECGRSDRAIAVAVSVARSTVQLCLTRFAAAGLTWPLPQTLTEQGLEALQFAPGLQSLGRIPSRPWRRRSGLAMRWRRNRGRVQHFGIRPGQHDDRHLLPLLAQLCTEIVTIDVRQPDIKDHSTDAPLAPSSSSASLLVPTAMAVVAADGIPFPFMLD